MKPKMKLKIFGSFSLILGLIATVYSLREPITDVTVELSKNTKWTPEFKSVFVENCAMETIKSAKTQYFTKQEELSEKGEEYFKKYSNTYCTCIASKIENQKIVKTKYNISRGIASYQSETEKEILRYMQSENGKEEVSSCIQLALKELRLN